MTGEPTPRRARWARWWDRTRRWGLDWVAGVALAVGALTWSGRASRAAEGSADQVGLMAVSALFALATIAVLGYAVLRRNREHDEPGGSSAPPPSGDGEQG